MSRYEEWLEEVLDHVFGMFLQTPCCGQEWLTDILRRGDEPLDERLCCIDRNVDYWKYCDWYKSFHHWCNFKQRTAGITMSMFTPSYYRKIIRETENYDWCNAEVVLLNYINRYSQLF